MKKVTILPFLMLLVMSMSSCRVIGDIFKAGVGVGIFIAVAVVALVIFLIAKLFGGGK